MFKAGSKDKPERYEGELELEPLQHFVNEMVRACLPRVRAVVPRLFLRRK